MTLHRPFLALFALLALACAPTPAATSPPRGSVAPPITLPDLSGKAVATTKLAPRTLVLIFGELGHERVRQACGDVLDVLADPRLAGDSILPILIVAQNAPPNTLKEEAALGRFPALILHDSDRQAFGAYRILVIPTVVVIDGKGIVVYSFPGFLERSKDLLTEALLAATGKKTTEQFEQAIEPIGPAATHEAVRADRLANLGFELVRHGLLDLAEARFIEATTLVPGHIGATLGLGDLMLKQNRLDDAEPLFRAVLASHPDSIDAATGLADVQIRRGGDDLAKAESALKAIIDKDPSQPRALYLLGQIHERRGEAATAMSEYRKALELLLSR